MNLDAYLSRIGYVGPRTPTLPVLRDIILAHTCAIPFENLDVLLGREIQLELPAIERKLVGDRRGGYCFEQNSLLLGALSTIGFSVRPLAGRVRIQMPREYTPPRTHLFLRVEVDGGSWLADVGLGGLTPTTPIRIDQIGTEQPTPHETRRIISEERTPAPRYFHQAKLGDTWVDVYEFTLDEMPDIDREVGNWWTSRHKNSKFRQNLLTARARPDGTRVSILNREFTHRRGAEVIERFEITDPDQLLSVLAERFGLVFPADTRFGAPGSVWPT